MPVIPEIEPVVGLIGTNQHIIGDMKILFERRGFILATRHKFWLEHLVGKTNTLELVGEPSDLNELVRNVIETYKILEQQQDKNLPSSQSVNSISY